MVLYKFLQSASAWGAPLVDLGSTYLVGKLVGTHNCSGCVDVHLEYSLDCSSYIRLTSAGVSTWQANSVSEAVRARCVIYPVPSCAICNFPAPSLSVYELLYCVTLTSSLDKSVVPPNSQFIVSGNTKDQYNNPMNGQVVKINIYKDGVLWAAETPAADASGNFSKTISTVAWPVSTYRVDVISDDIVQTFNVNVIYTSTVTFDAICTDIGSSCPASVFLDNEPKGTTPLTLNDIPVGTYNYRVTKSGYVDAIGTINVQQGVTTNVTVNLNPAIGNIYFSSEPEGASIILDDVLQSSVTPATLTGIPTGTHNYLLRKTNFLDYPSPTGGNVNVLLGETTNVSATLVPVEGCVYFNTVPQGAGIFIDDTDTGKVTPDLVCGLALGLHTYRLLLAGYQSTTGTVDLTSGQGVAISTALIVAKGNINFTSMPGGAEIFLDNIGQGVTTPVTITDIPIGTHNYALRLSNYNDFTGTVIVEENQTVQVSVSIIPVEGCIYFNTVPQGARIFIDDTDQTGTITPTLVCGITLGIHTYRLVLEGYYDKTGDINLVSGRGENISETMTLMPTTGDVCFLSNPPGASIIINGTLQTGKSTAISPEGPCTSESTVIGLTPGSYTYKLTLTGYLDKTGSFDVIAGITTTTDAGYLQQVAQAGFGAAGMILIAGLAIGAILMSRKKPKAEIKTK